MYNTVIAETFRPQSIKFWEENCVCNFTISKYLKVHKTQWLYGN